MGEWTVESALQTQINPLSCRDLAISRTKLGRTKPVFFNDPSTGTFKEIETESQRFRGEGMDFLGSLCCGGAPNKKVMEKKGPTWRTFSLKELYAATNNFSHDNRIGEGGFGTVYRGRLRDGSEIAVKRIKTWSTRAEMEFEVEVEILGRVRHRNLLSLRGYCAEEQQRLIVYDYMPNSSLASHLHGQHARWRLLDWSRRMNIAVGSAEGLAYLHHCAQPRIIHRDIKASNVLLDADFQAKVADFGFAKLIPDGATHVTTGVKGTLGYLAPEYAMFGKASESCDSYSFGILLLELVSGKKPISKLDTATKYTIAEWAAPLVSEGRYYEIADPKLQGKYDIEELKRVIHVATTCAQSAPEKRPKMWEVVNFLKGKSKENEENVKLEIVKYEEKLFEADGSSGSSSSNATMEHATKQKPIDNAALDGETLTQP